MVEHTPAPSPAASSDPVGTEEPRRHGLRAAALAVAWLAFAVVPAAGAQPRFGLTIRPPIGPNACATFPHQVQGEVRDQWSHPLLSLGAGCLYVGGGNATVYREGNVVPGGTFLFDVTGTTGDELTLGPSSGTGSADCTLGPSEMRRCANDPDTLCATDADCGNAAGACQRQPRCRFTAPMPLLDGPLPLCLVMTVADGAGGTSNRATGNATLNLPLDAWLYLPTETSVAQNGGTPCPQCVADVCQGGRRHGLACAPAEGGTSSADCPPNDIQFFATGRLTRSPLRTHSSTTHADGAGRFSSLGCMPRSRGAFAEDLARWIEVRGVAAGDLDAPGPHQGVLAGITCAGPFTSIVTDFILDTPGPVALTLFADVTPPACGNGALDPMEDCDDGPANGGAGSCCTSACRGVTVDTPCAVDACASGTCDGAGACVVTDVVDCNDDHACTSDTCDPATGECRYTWTGHCDDGDACTQEECHPGTGECIVTSRVDCTDDDHCTTSVCNPATGQCQQAGAIVCDDGSACTVDVCNPVVGCEYAPAVPTCDDGDPCTTDLCDPAGGTCFDVLLASCEQAVAAGTTLTTDSESDGATPDDPVETTVTSPVSGAISIVEQSIPPGPPTGYAFVGQRVTIHAPTATAQTPLLVAFRIDASAVPSGIDPTTIAVSRNGIVVSGCTGSGGTAVPDPCVASRIILADADVEITVRTSASSDWDFAVPSQRAGEASAQKLVIVQDETARGRASLSFASSDTTPGAIQKGRGSNPPSLTGTFTVSYVDAPTNVGRYLLPARSWTKNSPSTARYSNPHAPGGPPQDAAAGMAVKSASIRADRKITLTAKARGEAGSTLDLVAAPPGPGGILVEFALGNHADGFTYRTCTVFPNTDGRIRIAHVSGGLGRKLTARNGVPTPCP